MKVEFGTDGIRGVAGEPPLNPPTVNALGRAAGEHFSAESGTGTMLLGYDTRESSRSVAAWLTSGIVSAGVNVKNVGVIPTPGLSYLTSEGSAAASAMITASHNPYEDNGIKFFDGSGGKLSDETQQRLSRMVEDMGGWVTTKFGGVSYDRRHVRRYSDFLVDSAGENTSFDGLRVAVDTANGAASGYAEKAFTELGADVTSMSNKPDGRNINDNCGSQHTEALREIVTEQGLDMGIAHDGDADRVVMVDELGREINGDHIMYILAKANNYKGVVATHMTNLGAELAMREADIKLERTDVGDRHVLQKLLETGYPLGGEQSGHIIQPHLLATGDGMLTAIHTVKAVRESGMSLAEWRDQFEMFPQELVNIRLDSREHLNHPDVQAYIEDASSRFNGDGRLLIRPSGTEPLVRVMVESPKNAKGHAGRIAGDLSKLLARL